MTINLQNPWDKWFTWLSWTGKHIIIKTHFAWQSYLSCVFRNISSKYQFLKMVSGQLVSKSTRILGNSYLLLVNLYLSLTLPQSTRTNCNWTESMSAAFTQIYIVPSHNAFCITPDKSLIQVHVNIFLISPWKHMLWVLIRRPHWVTSNEQWQYIFSWRNKKITELMTDKKNTSGAKFIVCLQSVNTLLLTLKVLWPGSADGKLMSFSFIFS